MNRAHGLALALCCAIAGWGGAACSKKSAEVPAELACPDTKGAAPVDPPLLAFLSRARSAHHIADGREEAKDFAGASSALEQIVSGPRPGGDALPRPEVREVLSDTEARIADLKSQIGQFDDALTHVERGLGFASEITYYRGHLLEVRGHVEERRAKTLGEQGDAPGAAAAKQRALSAFEQSMAVQGRVIECSLGEGDKT